MIQNADIHGLILDMDGVLWRGEQPLGDLARNFEEIKRMSLNYMLVTNNATKAISQYVAQLASFGVEVPPELILNPALAAAQYLKQQLPHGSPVYVIGEAGLQSALEECGFILTHQNACAVVVALDRQCTYEKLCQATLLIRNGALFIGTNPDRTFPLPEGLVPGAGALIAALETASDRQAIIIGKPEPLLFKQALKRMHCRPEQALVVGDRLETDIAGGIATGCFTALVLSGVSTREQAQNGGVRPHLIAQNLTRVLEWAQNHISQGKPT